MQGFHVCKGNSWARNTRTTTETITNWCGAFHVCKGNSQARDASTTTTLTTYLSGACSGPPQLWLGLLVFQIA